MDKRVRLAIAADMLDVLPQSIRKYKHRYPLIQAKKGARIYMLLSDVYKLQGIFTPQKIDCTVNYEEVGDNDRDIN